VGQVWEQDECAQFVEVIDPGCNCVFWLPEDPNVYVNLIGPTVC